MSSYIILELDTTPPEIEIYAPSYTTTELFNEITIVSNENLSDYQEVYVIDSNGIRHNYTFHKEKDNEYVGIIKFTLFPVGMAKLCARLMDDVGNLSNIAEKPIEIKESLTILTLDINDRHTGLSVNESMANMVTKDNQSNTNIKERSMNIDSNEKSIKIEISDRKRSAN